MILDYLLDRDFTKYGPTGNVQNDIVRKMDISESSRLSRGSISLCRSISGQF